MKSKAAAIRTLLIITNHTSSQIASFHSSWFNSSNSLRSSQADLPSFSHLHWCLIFGSGLPSDLLHAKFPLHFNCLISTIIETLLWHPAFNAVLVTHLLALQAQKFTGSSHGLLRLSRALFLFFFSIRAFFPPLLLIHIKGPWSCSVMLSLWSAPRSNTMRTALQEMLGCSVFHHLCQHTGQGFHYLHYNRFFTDFKLIFMKSSPHIFPYILQKPIPGLCSSCSVTILPSK